MFLGPMVLGFILNSVCAGDQPGQVDIPTTEKMSQVPSPLDVRDWRQIAQKYYEQVLNPNAQGQYFSIVKIDPARPGFQIKTYLGSSFKDEGFTCLSAVIGSKLVGLDPRNLDGVDYVTLTDAWYDPKHGVYRHNIGDTSPVLDADIYGYWDAILGMILAAQYPDNKKLAAHARTSVEAFRIIAHGMGAPAAPHYDELGWDFQKNMPGGRSEPMNRLGHAPSVAWALLVGNQLNGGDPDLLACARATMQWYSSHPGRYEISHVMGPLVAARINSMGGDDQIDLGKVLNAWFGDGDIEHHPWGITSDTNLDGITCDGLDGAKRPNNGFYAFSMGSLQGPAWLVPVVRYAPRYARAIARYALNAANSIRLLEGYDLDANHQDHFVWKAKWDPDNLFFYEGLASSDPTSEAKYKPYARGDPVIFGWGTGQDKLDPKTYQEERQKWFGNTADNIALYMGNHVGFLGGISSLTKIPGIISWDCVTTDWFHPPAYPTQLVYNPYSQDKVLTLDLGASPIDLYDACQGSWIGQGLHGKFSLLLKADSAYVLVRVPTGLKISSRNGHLYAADIVVDWHSPRTTNP
jgi:hypothetical protein